MKPSADVWSDTQSAAPCSTLVPKGGSRRLKDKAVRAISIGQLNALLRLHLRPINVVVFDGSSGGCPREA